VRGQRPPGLADKRFASADIFAAVRPATGEDFALVLPRVSTAAMSRFLADFAASLRGDTHAVVVLDQAGWHGAKALKVPETVTLVPLPPYSPDLNPVERVWLYLRERDLSHRLLADDEAVVDASCAAWNKLTAEAGRIRSLTAYPYLEQVKAQARRYDTLAYRALNPNGLVPTLVEEDGFSLWESNVIVRHLCARHGMGGLCPADGRARFDVERWMDWQATVFWPSLRPLFFGLVRTPEAERDPAALAASHRDAAGALAILDAHLADRAHVGGEAFTMGDIPVGVAAHRWFALPIDRPDLRHLARWYGQLAARPAFAAHVGRPLACPSS
jgi:glutathione S-transferase/transposase